MSPSRRAATGRARRVSGRTGSRRRRRTCRPADRLRDRARSQARSSLEEQPDGDAEQECGEQQLDCARAKPLLHGRREWDRSRCREPDQRRIRNVDVPVECVCDHARHSGDADRCQRGRGRGLRLPAAQQKQQRHDDDPASDSEQRAEEPRDETDEDEPHARILGRVNLLARLAEHPSHAAIFLDVDGVLAPIVPRPEDARVPDETRAELRRLHSKYGLVACVSGRAGDDARRIVGVPELTFVGNHGLEAERDAELWAARLQDFLATVDWERVEDKRLTATLHYRDVPAEAAARKSLAESAEGAQAAGLVARYGRKVLELLPPLEAHKGTAVLRLLRERELERALYAGDDTT